MKNKIIKLASTQLSEVIEIRNHFHKHPELSFKEVNTSKYIISKLEEYKIPFRKGIAKTGIEALIEGRNPSKKVVALRADMDALPIIEENKTDYKSTISGVMHACGHDVHMASLLGTAKILNELKDEFEGTVKLIFQPSEEAFPGGAKLMIEEGILENPKPTSIFGQHTYPELEAGKVGFKKGVYMASTDEIYITVKGKGGHGATPNLNIDTVLIASHIVVALQQIVSRNAAPHIPTVLSFGRFMAEGRTNVIPDEVKIDGTLRTFSEEWRKDAQEKIIKIAKTTAEAMGGTAEVRIEKGYPFLVNDDELTERAMNYAIEYLGKENVAELSLRMTAEDFAYFSQKMPACYYRLGTSNAKKGITSNLHTSTFDVDPKSLEVGAGLMAWIAVCELKQA